MRQILQNNAKKGCVIFCQICQDELVDKFDKSIYFVEVKKIVDKLGI